MTRQYFSYLVKGLPVIIVFVLIFNPVVMAQIETGENITDSAVQFGQIQYFSSLLEETGLDDDLADGGPFTVFAPTDQAFREMDDDLLQELLENPDELRKVLRGHIIEASMLTEELSSVDEVTSMGDTQIEVDHHEQGMSVGVAQLVAANIVATNGVIHAIDTVLLP